MIKQIEKLISSIESCCMIIFMSAAVTITFIQVVYRFGFGGSIFWGQEVVIYSIIAMSFVGASMGVDRGVHISVDVLTTFLPSRINKYLHLVMMAFGVVFGFLMLFFGFKLFYSNLMRGQLTPALQLPMAWFYSPIFISGALLIFRYLVVFKKAWGTSPESFSLDFLEAKDNLV